MPREKTSLRGHFNPLADFVAFVSKWKPVTFDESLRFVRKVKSRDIRLYVSLGNILSEERLTSAEIYQELTLLLQNHDDLRDELERFKPRTFTRGGDGNNAPQNRFKIVFIILFFFLILHLDILFRSVILELLGHKS